MTAASRASGASGASGHERSFARQAEADCDASAATPAAQARPAGPSVALLQLVRWQARALPWGWLQLMLGQRSVASTPGLRLTRVLGSGRDGGFGLAPSLVRHGLMTFFDHEDQARTFAAKAPAMVLRRERSHESLTALLRVTSSRGSWNRVALAPAPALSTTPPPTPSPALASMPMTVLSVDAATEAAPTPQRQGPVASLTRASIRPLQAARFWRHAPATQADVCNAAGCRLAVGLGEAPLLRQATFSLWDDDAALVAYAQSGAHRAAAQGAWQQQWFSESMFTRFEVLHIEGTWHGTVYA